MQTMIYKTFKTQRQLQKEPLFLANIEDTVSYHDKPFQSDGISFLPSLRPEDAQILSLRFEHEMALDEIAQTLGISEGAVKMRLRRAKENARKFLEKEKYL